MEREREREKRGKENRERGWRTRWMERRGGEMGGKREERQEK